jgi:hypothetical protein
VLHLEQKAEQAEGHRGGFEVFDDFLGEIAKLPDSSRLSSLSQKMSRLAL